MHELSLASHIVDTVDAALAREGETQARQLRLAVGQLAGVEPSALRFALEALAPRSSLRHCEIVIDLIAGQGRCLHCHATTPLAQRGDPCALCGQHPVQATEGLDLRIVELLVAHGGTKAHRSPDALNDSAHAAANEGTGAPPCA